MTGAQEPRHTVTIVAAPKFDTPTLAAACSCDNYRSGPASAPAAKSMGEQHVAAATVNDASAILDAGLAWLFDTAQSDTAITQHHGAVRSTPDRTFQFVPRAFYGDGAVIVMGVHPRFADLGGAFLNPLTKYDVHALTGALIQRGHTIVDLWNGAGTDSVSIRVHRVAHPSLTDAVDRYQRRCPTHNTVFCGREYDEPCSWFTDGYADLIKPNWPAPAPTPEVTP